jgi:hypothetical protein
MQLVCSIHPSRRVDNEDGANTRNCTWFTSVFENAIASFSASVQTDKQIFYESAAAAEWNDDTPLSFSFERIKFGETFDRQDTFPIKKLFPTRPFNEMEAFGCSLRGAPCSFSPPVGNPAFRIMVNGLSINNG